MALPRHLLVAMARHPDVEEVHLAVSKGAVQVLKHETDFAGNVIEALVATAQLQPEWRQKISIYRENELDAPISSGSFTLTGTAIVPCSAGTAGALATGAAGTLVHRAGAVALKERWPLVLGFRETPLTVIHLENLRRLAYLGATILPPMPAFYVGGEDFDRFLDHYVLRVLDAFGIYEPGQPGLRWKSD
jgi:4-hydroxy-3-polyprenylbenzoate decarboxylase